MADVEGLYVVTAVVLVGLFGWVFAVLVRAPTAIDETLHAGPPSTVRLPRKPSSEEPPAAAAEAPVEVAAEAPAEIAPPEIAPAESAPAESAPAESAPEGEPPPQQEKTEPPIPAPEEAKVPPAAPVAAPVAAPIAAPIAAIAVILAKPNTSPPVVVLPPIRHRLDSHPEIQDTGGAAPVIVMPEDGATTLQGQRFALVTAFGRTDPEPGKTPERHAILEKDHLFVFADAGGRKAGQDLVGSIAVDALTDAFAKDEKSGFADDPKLPARANRIRRAVLAGNRQLLKRAREMAFAGLGASAFAACFSPTNEQLFVAHVGANRAYRLRGGELTRLTSAQGSRQVGLRERVEVEVVMDATQPKDTYLFCSDGLGRAMTDAELATALKADPSLEEVTRRLIAAANAKGHARDVLAIVVRVDAPPPAPEKKPARVRTVLGLG